MLCSYHLRMAPDEKHPCGHLPHYDLLRQSLFKIKTKKLNNRFWLTGRFVLGTF